MSKKNNPISLSNLDTKLPTHPPIPVTLFMKARLPPISGGGGGKWAVEDGYLGSGDPMPP